MTVPQITGHSIELVDLVARSDSSEVWRGEDADQGRTVAVKIFAAEPSDTGGFQAEVDALKRLSLHPGILTIFSAATTDDERLCLILQFADSGSLTDHLSQGPVGWHTAIGWVSTALEAIAYCHQEETWHGDLKPSNLLLDSRAGVLVADFDSAQLRAEGQGSLRATPSYTAPELFRGSSSGPRADMYAVGAILYELISGSPPVVPRPGEPILSFAKRTASEPPAPLENCPSVLAELISDLLHHDPDQRPSALSALAQLRQLEDATTVEGAPLPTGGRQGASVFVMEAALIVVAVVAVGLGVFHFGGDASEWAASTLMATPTTVAPAAPPSSVVAVTTTIMAISTTTPPAEFSAGGFHVRRMDLNMPVVTPVGAGDSVWAISIGNDGSHIHKLGTETSLQISSGAVTDSPTAYGDYVLFPFVDQTDMGVSVFSAVESRVVVRRRTPSKVDGSETLPATPIWLGDTPVGASAVLLPLSLSAGQPYITFLGVDELKDLTPESLPGRAVSTPIYGEGSGLAIYEVSGVMSMRAFEAENLLPRDSRLPVTAGKVQPILHPAPDGSIWLVSRERVVTRIVPDMDHESGGPLSGDLASAEHVEAGDCPVEDILAGCIGIPPGGHGLVAFGGFWVGNAGDGLLYRVDLDSLEVSSTGPVGANPGTPAATSTSVWVTDLDTGVASEVDPTTLEVITQIELPCPGGTCEPWPEGLEWRHRPLGEGETVWIPWGESIFSVERGQ